MNKQEVIEFLRANPRCHLATVDEGAPRVRAIGTFKVDEDGIVIQTWKDKDLGKQLARNPEVELCFNNYDDGIQIRVRGKVNPIEDEAVKKQVLLNRPRLRRFVDEGHELVLYCLSNGLAHMWTMEKNFEPKVFLEL